MISLDNDANNNNKSPLSNITLLNTPSMMTTFINSSDHLDKQLDESLMISNSKPFVSIMSIVDDNCEDDDDDHDDDRAHNGHFVCSNNYFESTRRENKLENCLHITNQKSTNVDKQIANDCLTTTTTATVNASGEMINPINLLSDINNNSSTIDYDKLRDLCDDDDEEEANEMTRSQHCQELNISQFRLNSLRPASNQRNCSIEASPIEPANDEKLLDSRPSTTTTNAKKKKPAKFATFLKLIRRPNLIMKRNSSAANKKKKKYNHSSSLNRSNSRSRSSIRNAPLNTSNNSKKSKRFQRKASIRVTKRHYNNFSFKRVGKSKFLADDKTHKNQKLNGDDQNSSNQIRKSSSMSSVASSSSSSIANKASTTKSKFNSSNSHQKTRNSIRNRKNYKHNQNINGISSNQKASTSSRGGKSRAFSMLNKTLMTTTASSNNNSNTSSPLFKYKLNGKSKSFCDPKINNGTLSASSSLMQKSSYSMASEISLSKELTWYKMKELDQYYRVLGKLIVDFSLF